MAFPSDLRREQAQASSQASVLTLLLEALAVTLVVVALLEGGSRVVHGNVRQMLPYVADASMSPRMPASFDSQVQFSGSAAFRVCTDRFGLRGSTCEDSGSRPAVLTVGDSQAFGWAMEFGDTFTAEVARGLGERSPQAARAMAAGGADVESLRGWARDYRAAVGDAHPGRLNIVTVNLGNDLDEMYFGRASGEMPVWRGPREWLTVHSFFMLDFNLLKARFTPGGLFAMPPGANPVIAALSASERQQLALATSKAARRLADALPAARQTVVLLLPNDTQVAPGEFAKYRGFYPSSQQFEGWQRRVAATAAALNEIEDTVARELRAQGVTVVAPRRLLATHDPAALFDRQSHHYTRLGQTVLASAILEAVGAKTASPSVQEALR